MPSLDDDDVFRKPGDSVYIRPSQLVGRLFQLNGQPYSIADYPYLQDIYDTNAREVGLFTGRQVGKSTVLASKIVMEAVVSPPGTHQILVTPLQDQAYVFSTTRLKDFIYDSPIVRDGFFTGPSVIDQMLRKQFSNGNMVSLGYAQRTADRLRGRSAARLKWDEIQDIFPDVVSIIREMAFRRTDANFWYCGTPKTFNNHMEKYRNRSTGAEWAVKCQEAGCNHWNYTWNEKNIGITGVVCELCQKPINTNLGQWIVARTMDLDRGRDSKCTMESYRIAQLLVKPIMDDPVGWRELITKLKEYSTEQFNNEVLALAFDGGTQPITDQQLRECCDSKRHNVLPDPNDSTLPPLVIGVDWAFNGEESYTFIIIGAWESFPFKFNVYYWKIFKGVESDSLYQIDWIAEHVQRHNIRLIGADWGAGHVQNLTLVNRFGENAVAQMWHTGMKAAGGSKAQNRAKFEPKTRKWHLARTAVLTDTFEDLRKGRIRFPRYEECEELFKHILAESLEFDVRTNRASYTNVDPDDGLHSLCYAQLAGELLIKGGFGGHLGSTPVSANTPSSETEFDIWNEETFPVEHGYYQ